MKYEVLVSHGKLAEGLKDALSMLAGQRKDVIACGLENGKSADEFAKEFAQAIDVITEDDEIVLLGDLIGGSPLTTALNVINEKGFADNTLIIGGMNLPLALTVVLMKDTFDNDTLLEQVLNEAHGALREFKIEVEDEDDI
ncbi:MAG: PTS fructose transporter subunit IIA [Erysipelotrichaceae bacterium]|nr:PTS fructose transporter subunit IIA [Erysipelotrichaceae bacterium]